MGVMHREDTVGVVSLLTVTEILWGSQGGSVTPTDMDPQIRFVVSHPVHRHTHTYTTSLNYCVVVSKDY